MKRFAAFAVLFCITISLISCSNDRYGRSKLCEALFSRFCADVELTMSRGDEKLECLARITKNDRIRIDILSPESLAGISVESDNGGSLSTLSFTYDGISADLPADAFSKLNLAILLFSPEIPNAIERLTGANIYDSSDNFYVEGLSDYSPVCAEFSVGIAEICAYFDKRSGTPLCFTAKSDDVTVCALIKNFSKDD